MTERAGEQGPGHPRFRLPQASAARREGRGDLSLRRCPGLDLLPECHLVTRDIAGGEEQQRREVQGERRVPEERLRPQRRTEKQRGQHAPTGRREQRFRIGERDLAREPPQLRRAQGRGLSERGFGGPFREHRGDAFLGLRPGHVGERVRGQGDPQQPRHHEPARPRPRARIVPQAVEPVRAHHHEADDGEAGGARIEQVHQRRGEDRVVGGAHQQPGADRRGQAGLPVASDRGEQRAAEHRRAGEQPEAEGELAGQLARIERPERAERPRMAHPAQRQRRGEPGFRRHTDIRVADVLAEELDLGRQHRCRQTGAEQDARSERPQRLGPSRRSDAAVSGEQRAEKEREVGVRLQVAGVEHGGGGEGDPGDRVPRAGLPRVMEREPEPRIPSERGGHPRVAELHDLAAGELPRQRQPERQRRPDAEAPEEQEHAGAGDDEVQDARPVVGRLERQDRVAQPPDRIGPVDVRIGQERASAEGVRVPPRHLAAPHRRVDGALQRQVVDELVEDVVVVRDRASRGERLELRQQGRSDVQRCQERAAPERVPEEQESQQQLHHQEPGERSAGRTTACGLGRVHRHAIRRDRPRAGSVRTAAGRGAIRACGRRGRWRGRRSGPPASRRCACAGRRSSATRRSSRRS